MHPFNGSGGTSFNFNSDFSGPLIIRTTGGEIQIPAMDVVELVADYVSRRKIEALEQATAQDILGIGPSLSEQIAEQIDEHEKQRHLDD